MQKVNKQEVIENITILKLKQDQEADLLNDLMKCDCDGCEDREVCND